MSPSHSHQQQEMNYFLKQKEQICSCVLKQHHEPWVAPDAVSENQEPELHSVSTHSITTGPQKVSRCISFIPLDLLLNHLRSLDKRRTSNTQIYLLFFSTCPSALRRHYSLLVLERLYKLLCLFHFESSFWCSSRGHPSHQTSWWIVS